MDTRTLSVAEKNRAKVKDWAKANPDRLRAYRAQWRALNPEKVKAYRDRHRAKTPKSVANGYAKKSRQQPAVKLKRAFIQRTRHASQLARTPPWADLPAIKLFYCGCPADHHVDHVIPLKGKTVSGLHVETNLQYLPAAENIRKRNSFEGCYR